MCHARAASTIDPPTRGGYHSPMRTLLFVLTTIALVPGCPGPSTPDDTGGTGVDSGTTDGGGTDGGSTDGGSIDGGTTDGGSTDGGTTDGGTDAGGDAPILADAPIDAPSTTSCPDGLGYFCEGGVDCPSGYECNVGRCAPQGRDLCGGVAGARCTDPEFPSCLYFATADFGPCMTPEEVACICADPRRSPGFVCP